MDSGVPHPPPFRHPSPRGTFEAMSSPTPVLDPHRVDLVLWDGVELLDFAGPGQVFAAAGFRVRTLAARPGPLRSQGFLEVVPEAVLPGVAAAASPPPASAGSAPPEGSPSHSGSPSAAAALTAPLLLPPRIFVVPGGSSEVAVDDDLLVAGVAQAARETLAAGGIVLSVCTGALVLAAARLLDDLEATTWHGALDRLREAAPRTRVMEGRR